MDIFHKKLKYITKFHKQFYKTYKERMLLLSGKVYWYRGVCELFKFSMFVFIIFKCDYSWTNMSTLLILSFCLIFNSLLCLPGLYHKQKCPKGKTCNFLHVFKNPNNAFKIYNSSSRQQLSRSQSRSPQRRSK